MEQNNNEQNNEAVKNDKTGKTWIWVIIVAIFICIVALVVMLVGGNGKITSIFRGNTNNANSSLNECDENEVDDLNFSGEVKKPIIYLYPEEQTELSVTLGKPEIISSSYPKYENGWNVIANPDGSLVDKNTGRELYSLYWEGNKPMTPEYTEGFCVKGEDTIAFLEEKLALLGLNEKEAEEFIIYWLPKMENNKYNYVRFATMEEINEYMPLYFSVQPDTLIRVIMQYKPLEEPIEVKEQVLETPERNGFVAVEWGGAKVK